MKKRRSLIYSLAVFGAAALVAGMWWHFAQMHRTRPTMRDAVFVRRIEEFIRKG